MSDPIIFWPDAQPLSIQIATWNTSTLVQEWHEVSQFCPVPGGLQLGTRPAQGGVADGTLALEIPIIEDSYNFEAWNEVRISGTVAGPPVGGYPRHFRGYALKRDSHTDGIENIYSFQLVDGWMRVEKPPAALVDERTWRGDDAAIIHAMAYNCWPDLYPSGAATPAAPVTAPTATAHTTGGTLTAGKWRVAYAWSNPSGPTALSNSAIPVITGTTGSITVTIPGTLPAGATGAQLYVAADADLLDRVWYADVAGPGTYTITDPPTGSLPPLAAILPYPTAPTTDQPNVNNYSSVQPPPYGVLTVTTKAATLAQALDAVEKAVPADYEVPRAMLWWKPDNSAHTAGWDWQLTWLRDTDTPIYGIVAINVNYTQPEDSTHTFYYSMQRSRDGGPVGNVQTVQGDWIEADNRYATATVSSSVSYQEIGVYLSLPPVIDRDLKTDAECAAKARQLLDAAKLVQETLSNVVTYTPYPILGATRVRVYNAYEGGLDDPVEANLPVYTIAHAQATYTEAGLEYQLELGAGFAELGEARTRFVGGSGTTTSTAPPAVPQWHDTPADDILSNTYDPVSHLSTLLAAWLPDLTGLVTDYEARYAWDGGTTWIGPVSVPVTNPPTITLVGTPGAAATIQVRAHNTHNVVSAWSASRTITLAAREQPAAPVWVSAYTTATESAVLGNATLTWTDGVGGTGTPAYWEVSYVPHSGGQTMTLKTALRSILIHALLIGTTYDVTVQAFTTNGDPGVVSAVKSVIVNQDSPGAPATVTVTGTRTGPATGQANLSWTAGTGGTGTVSTYQARYYVTASGSSTAVIVNVPTDNRVLTIPGLPVGTQYTFNVRSLNPYGVAGPWSTSAPTLTLAAQAPPAPTGLTVLDYDPGSTGQSAWILLGWTAGTGGSGTVATYNVRVDWTESSTGVVRKWHKDGIPATDTSTILSPLTAGPSYTITLWGITAWGDSSSAATLTYSVTPAAPMGLYNGNFEIPDPSNKTLPDGWAIGTAGTGSGALDSSTARLGTQSFKMSRTASAGTVTLTSRQFLFKPGRNYMLRWSQRSDEATPTTVVQANVKFYDSAGFNISVPVTGSAPAASNTWEDIAISVGSPAATSVLAEVSFTVTILQASKHFWLDAVSLEPQAATTDYADASITKGKFDAALAPIQKGTSNPASPSSGDRNWRTDIGRDAYYDGTRWVTPDVKLLPFEAPNAITATTTTGANVGRLNHNGDLDWLLYRFAASVFVATTNNASNYWTLTLRYITAGNTVTNVATMTTAAIAANTWARIATNTFSPVTAPATAFMLEVIASTTGAPGSLLVVPQLLIREIMP